MYKQIIIYFFVFMLMLVTVMADSVLIENGTEWEPFESNVTYLNFEGDFYANTTYVNDTCWVIEGGDYDGQYCEIRSTPTTLEFTDDLTAVFTIAKTDISPSEQNGEYPPNTGSYLDCIFKINSTQFDKTDVSITWFRNSEQVNEYNYTFENINTNQVYQTEKGKGSVPDDLSQGDNWFCQVNAKANGFENATNTYSVTVEEYGVEDESWGNYEDNLKMSWGIIVTIILGFAGIIFYAQDERIGIIMHFVTLSLGSYFLYLLEFDYVYMLTFALMMIVLLSFSLYFSSKTEPRAGGFA